LEMDKTFLSGKWRNPDLDTNRGIHKHRNMPVQLATFKATGNSWFVSLSL
jgi:hypothetical protein